MNKIVKILIISTYFSILCGCDKVKDNVNQINDIDYTASIRSAEMIISNVELSYNNAYLSNYGNYPTIKQVSSKFNMNNVVMDEDGIIVCKDSNINCVTNTDDNNLSVICTVDDKEFSTLTNMPLSLDNT